MFSRYILPTIQEKTSYGIKTLDPYTKLYEEGIIFLGTPIDDTVANDIMAQLLTLESINSERDIMMYINSPGGSFTAMTAIYDTMKFIKNDITTICLGQAASAAAVLLGAGSRGKRLALKNSRILLHQPMSEGRGQGSDIEIQANEVIRIKRLQEEMLSESTGRKIEDITKDLQRDLILSAEKAVEYGIIDQILSSRKSIKNT